MATLQDLEGLVFEVTQHMIDTSIPKDDIHCAVAKAIRAGLPEGWQHQRTELYETRLACHYLVAESFFLNHATGLPHAIVQLDRGDPSRLVAGAKLTIFNGVLTFAHEETP